MNNNFETKKRELLNPLFVEAGAALMDCQTFEYGVSFLLYHFSRLGVDGLDPRQTIAIMENESKKTAGQLVNMVKKHCEVSDSLVQKLTTALEARNRLIHTIIIENVEKIPNAESRNELIKEISLLRSKVRDADKVVRSIVEILSKIIDGVDSKMFHEEFKTKLN